MHRCLLSLHLSSQHLSKAREPRARARDIYISICINNLVILSAVSSFFFVAFFFFFVLASSSNGYRHRIVLFLPLPFAARLAEDQCTPNKRGNNDANDEYVATDTSSTRNTKQLAVDFSRLMKITPVLTIDLLRVRSTCVQWIHLSCTPVSTMSMSLPLTHLDACVNVKQNRSEGFPLLNCRSLLSF